jgi:hypothetical protein
MKRRTSRPARSYIVNRRPLTIELSALRKAAMNARSRAITTGAHIILDDAIAPKRMLPGE